MDVSQFYDHLDLYGGDLSVWPADVRREADVLLATSDAAQSALRATKEFEAHLRKPVEFGGPSSDAIAARAVRERQHRVIPVGVRRGGWTTAAAAALVLGVFIGNVGSQQEESPDQVMAAAFDSVGTFDVD